MYGAAMSDEYVQSPFIDTCAEPPTSDYGREQPASNKFPAFVSQDIIQQDRPWFHEYKRRRTNEVPGVRAEALCGADGRESRLLAPPVCIDLTLQSSGLKSRFQSGLSLMRGFVPPETAADDVRHVYRDMQNSRS